MPQLPTAARRCLSQFIRHRSNGRRFLQTRMRSALKKFDRVFYRRAHKCPQRLGRFLAPLCFTAHGVPVGARNSWSGNKLPFYVTQNFTKSVYNGFINQHRHNHQKKSSSVCVRVEAKFFFDLFYFSHRVIYKLKDDERALDRLIASVLWSNRIRTLPGS